VAYEAGEDPAPFSWTTKRGSGNANGDDLDVAWDHTLETADGVFAEVDFSNATEKGQKSDWASPLYEPIEGGKVE
jgi:hypothetical protein